MKVKWRILLLGLFLFASVLMQACGQSGVVETEELPQDEFNAATPPPQEDERSLQVGNTFPTARLRLQNSEKLDDNRIGGNAETIHIDERFYRSGGKWMRAIIDPHGEWQYADWSTDDYKILPEDEAVIDELIEHGVKVMLVLDVWHTGSRTVTYKTEEDIIAFTNWTRFVVRHFKGRINYYEILNEPNLDLRGPGGMPVPNYVELVSRTVPVIHEEDPQAKVVVGAVPDTRFLDARKWIRDLINSDIMLLVDGISWHGMYGAAPSDDTRGMRQLDHPQVREYWETYPEFVNDIQSTAAANGFTGEFMSEEMLWRTPENAHETEPDKFTDIAAAKYLARAIVLHLGLDVAPGLALPDDSMEPSFSVVRVFSNVMAGAEVVEINLSIDSESDNIEHYGFSLPNGDRLLAIWIDDAAVDDFPGAAADLMISEIAAEKVSGIDVLKGIEQELVFEIEDGVLVIKDILLMDYPLIIRF